LAIGNATAGYGYSFLRFDGREPDEAANAFFWEIKKIGAPKGGD